MTFVRLRLVVGAIVLGVAALGGAQEAPVRVWGVRVLATDVEALRYAFVKDPDGNQIELIMEAK